MAESFRACVGENLGCYEWRGKVGSRLWVFASWLVASLCVMAAWVCLGLIKVSVRHGWVLARWVGKEGNREAAECSKCDFLEVRWMLSNAMLGCHVGDGNWRENRAGLMQGSCYCVPIPRYMPGSSLGVHPIPDFRSFVLHETLLRRGMALGIGQVHFAEI